MVRLPFGGKQIEDQTLVGPHLLHWPPWSNSIPPPSEGRLITRVVTCRNEKQVKSRAGEQNTKKSLLQRMLVRDADICGSGGDARVLRAGQGVYKGGLVRLVGKGPNRRTGGSRRSNVNLHKMKTMRRRDDRSPVSTVLSFQQTAPWSPYTGKNIFYFYKVIGLC